MYRQPGDRLFVDSMDVTADGVGISGGRVRRLVGGDDAKLGNEVLAALSAAGRTVPHPKNDEWSGVTKRWLNSMEAKSHRAFMNNAVAASVILDGGVVRVLATLNRGVRGGFEDRAEAAEEPSIDAATLGAAVRRALDASAVPRVTSGDAD